MFADDIPSLMPQPDRHLFALHSDEECGHCKRFEPEWNNVLDRLSPHPNLTVAKLDPDATNFMNNHHCRRLNHEVNAVPTVIYHTVNKINEYDGELTANKIIDWLKQVMADNNLELTLKSKSQDDEPDMHVEPPMSVEPVPIEQPVPVEPVPVEQPVPVEPVPVEPDLTAFVAPPSDLATTESPSQDAFPQEPLSPESTLSNATEAIKDTVAGVDDTIEEGVTALKSALTGDIDLFSSSSPTADAFPAVPAIVPAVPAVVPVVPAIVPVVPAAPAQNTPSVVGGVRRKCTRRRNHKCKKSYRKHKKSKKSKKSKK